MNRLFEYILSNSPSDLCTKLLDKLKDTKFIEDSASYKYHHCYPQGLMAHSYEVYNELKKLVELNKDVIGEVSAETLFLIGFGHDLEKIGSYIFNFDTNSYDYKFHKMFGMYHGEYGFDKLCKYLGEDDFRLHNDYKLIKTCIYGHMGEFERTNRGKQYYRDNVDGCPLLWLTTQADGMSCLLNGSTVSDYLDTNLIKVEVQYKISEKDPIESVIILDNSVESASERFNKFNLDWIPINYEKIT